jgi:hypothetical protein
LGVKLAVGEMDMKRLGTAERETKKDIWPGGRATNQDLWELYKDLDTVADIKKKILEWIRHLKEWRVFTKIFESKL